MNLIETRSYPFNDQTAANCLLEECKQTKKKDTQELEPKSTVSSINEIQNELVFLEQKSDILLFDEKTLNNHTKKTFSTKDRRSTYQLKGKKIIIEEVKPLGIKSRPRRNSESDSPTPSPTDILDSSEKTISTGPKEKSEKRKSSMVSRLSIKKSSSTEVILPEANSLSCTLDRIILVSSMIDELNEKQAITGRHVFCKVKLNEAKLKDRQECVQEILKIIRIGTEVGLIEIQTREKHISFVHMVNYLEKAKWSKSVFKNSEASTEVLQLTKQAIQNAALTIKEAELSRLQREEFPSIILVELLLSGKIEIDKIMPLHNLTLNDLSFIFPKFITPLNLFERVIKALDQKLLPANDKRLTDFCVKCLSNEVACSYYPDELIEAKLIEISKYLPVNKKRALIEAYDQIVLLTDNRKNAKPTEIEKLNSEEKPRITSWYQTIEEGLWNYLNVKACAASITKKTFADFSSVALDELLSEELDNPKLCPRFYQYTVFINSLTWLVAQDILRSKTEKKRCEMIAFYIEVINECLKKGDFASALALERGLDLSIITRLKKTWKLFSEKFENQNARLMELNELFNPFYNFKNLKEMMRNFKGDFLIQPPFLFSKDIKAIDENPNEVNGLINQFKFRLLSRSVIIPFQNIKLSLSAAKFQKQNIFDRRLETIGLELKSEEDLENLSLSIEPKKSEVEKKHS
ncbi:MAG: hypothetical protein H0T62_00215 [Parachlamydiaceae bacterium]|nr:hypothetical protein [Parachlamydiaceae bacterium]